MPIMASWVDYLPDPRQKRDLVDAAIANARHDAAILRDLGIDGVAQHLGAAAAEAAKLSILAGHASEVIDPYRVALARVLPALAQAANPYGVLAFANVILAHGRYVDGYYDRSTRAGLDREVAIVEAFARAGRSSRELAYVALGTGRRDLLRALSDDRALRGLADACDAGDAAPFYDFVASFPESDVGYAELVFVARAFVVVVEDRGAGGIGGAAAWLDRAVYQGPQPLVRYRPRQPLAPPSVQIGPSSLSWSTIAYAGIHPLWGGRSIAISSIGDCEVVDVEAGEDARRFRATLAPAALAELDALIARHHPRTIHPPLRNGVPDEGRPEITLVAGAETFAVSKWANDRDAAFDALAGWMARTAASLVR
jgi:hypothetical protein